MLAPDSPSVWAFRFGPQWEAKTEDGRKGVCCVGIGFRVCSYMGDDVNDPFAFVFVVLVTTLAREALRNKDGGINALSLSERTLVRDCLDYRV